MSWQKLNVGGEMFETTRETLTKFPNSRLAEMVNSVNKDDVLRLDRDPEYFRPILNWLRLEQGSRNTVDRQINTFVVLLKRIEQGPMYVLAAYIIGLLDISI